MDECTTIYSDGGCSGNPGPGAWAFAKKEGDVLVTKSGSARATTNNRMELTAVICALTDCEPKNKGHLVNVYTDSQYVKKGITEWISKWKTHEWKNSSGQPVKNRDLWEKLLDLSGRFEISWRWVMAHSGDELNELCDSLVKQEIKRLKRR